MSKEDNFTVVYSLLGKHAYSAMEQCHRNKDGLFKADLHFTCFFYIISERELLCSALPNTYLEFNKQFGREWHIRDGGQLFSKIVKLVVGICIRIESQGNIEVTHVVSHNLTLRWSHVIFAWLWTFFLGYWASARILFILEKQTWKEKVLSQPAITFSFLSHYLTLDFCPGTSVVPFDVTWITGKQMAALGPDLQDCFDYLRAMRKFDDPYNSNNISKMAANFILQVFHSHEIRSHRSIYLWISLFVSAQIWLEGWQQWPCPIPGPLPNLCYLWPFWPLSTFISGGQINYFCAANLRIGVTKHRDSSQLYVVSL